MGLGYIGVLGVVDHSNLKDVAKPAISTGNFLPLESPPTKPITFPVSGLKTGDEIP